MAKYASGKHAWGICDKTGFRYPLSDLVYEYRNGKRTGMRVGRDVYDKDHPQNFVGRVKTDDAQALRDPRPDRETDRGLFGFDPVWNDSQYMEAKLGYVTVTIPQVLYDVYEVTSGSTYDGFKTADTGLFDVVKA